ncbi:M1 family peptidase [Streptomyces sp. YC537]|uniref:Aminopeptidase N n=1 Tax=Streptomyces boluensis TaxID=1775135 RepID=A0A964V127_9ACTN|nr:M1 family metallopeptidase [Streptomyces boluensis]NBE56627.1 M1 family peptidase [Streptomyces boluensis]
MRRRPPLSRTAPAALAAATALALTACAGSGVQGRPGAAGLRDPYFADLGNGGYDVRHYDLDLDYDPETGRLEGEAVITARASQDLSAFDLDLRGLDVASVTVDGRPARFNRARSELTVRPRNDLRAGATFRTTVRYSGAPETVTDEDGAREGWLPTAAGAVALGQPVGSMAWFPGNHHPSDKATYDIEITVPKGLRAYSNGELKAQRTVGDSSTFDWHSGEPMASYLATVAIGAYGTSTSVVKGASREGGLPVRTAVVPEEAEASRKVLAKLPEIVEWQERNFGPYPFSSVGAIVEGRDAAGYALETQTKPVFPGAPDTPLLVHELAHQWFGNSVTPKTWQDMWLNEGFATYAEWLWSEDHGGDSAQEIFDQVYAGKGDYVTENIGNAGEAEAVWAFPPAEPTGADAISDSPVYYRGAMVIHKIRQAVGDDRFRDLVRGWTRTHRHGNADTRDFTAYVEKRAGKDLDGLWDTWLYGEGKPARP